MLNKEKKGSIKNINNTFLITISLVFIFAFLFSGTRSNAQQFGCCEDFNGSVCVETSIDQCIPGPFTPTSCNNVFNCKKGCCVTDDGCSYNTPKKLCTGENSNFLDDAMCNVNNCQKVCCIYPGLNNGIGWDITSKIGCEKGAELGGFIPEMFYTSDPDICRQFYDSSDLGCCVIDRENKCLYTTRESCNSNNGQFNLRQYCSNPNICSSRCSRHYGKGCGEDSSKVYYFDSCGNKEEVFMECNDHYACSDIRGEVSCEYASCVYNDEKNDIINKNYNPGDTWCGYDYNISKVLNGEGRPGVGWSDHIYACGPNNIINVFQLNADGSTRCIIDGGDAKESSNVNIEDCTKLTDKIACSTNSLCMWVDTFVEFKVLEEEKRFLYGTYDENSEWGWLTDIRGFNDNVCLPRYPLNSEEGSAQECSAGTIEHGEEIKDRLTTWSETGIGWGAWHCMATLHSRCYLGGSGWTPSTENEGAFISFGADAVQWENGNLIYGFIETILDEGDSHITSNPNENRGWISATDREAIWSTAMAKRCRQLGSCGAYENWVGIRSTTGARLKKDKRTIPFFIGPDYPGKSIGVEFFTDPEVNSPYTNALNPWTHTQVRISQYSFYCDPWTAPAGGDDCHLCNEDLLRPCNQIRCESLGQTCKFEDIYGCTAGTVRDIIPPTVVSCNKVITSGNGGSSSSQCENGADVENFENITIRLETSEDAQCIYIEDGASPDFGNVQYWLANNEFTKVHSKTLRYSPEENDVYKVLTYSCQDKAGNRMQRDQEIRFTIKKMEMGNNRFPPELISTSPDNASYLSMGSGISNMTFYVYLNENATCKWSAPNDLPYETMPNEFEVNYSTGGPDQVIYYGYTNLTLQGGIVNIFYLKCNDSVGNINPLSYVIVFYPAPELFIDFIEPETGSTIETCAGSVNNKTTLNVTTSGGSENGISVCSWKDNNQNSRWKEFTETNSNTHSTEIEIVPDLNNISVSCRDSTSSVINDTIFYATEDHGIPQIIRFYKEGDELVIKTNENATCSFNKNIASCNFNASDFPLKAWPFGTSDGLEHRTAWRDKPWYVKCYDKCENGAAPSEDCTIIVPQDLKG